MPTLGVNVSRCLCINTVRCVSATGSCVAYAAHSPVGRGLFLAGPNILLHCCRLSSAGSDPVWGMVVFVVRETVCRPCFWMPAPVKHTTAGSQTLEKRGLHCVLPIGTHFPPSPDLSVSPPLLWGPCCSPCESENGAARPGRGAGGDALLGVQDQGDDGLPDQLRQGMRGLESWGCSCCCCHGLQVVCTLGPASRAVEVIEELLRAGMNVARFNFSHGSHEYHKVRVADGEQSKRCRRPMRAPAAPRAAGLVWQDVMDWGSTIQAG